VLGQETCTIKVGGVLGQETGTIKTHDRTGVLAEYAI